MLKYSYLRMCPMLVKACFASAAAPPSTIWVFLFFYFVLFAPSTNWVFYLSYFVLFKSEFVMSLIFAPSTFWVSNFVRCVNISWFEVVSSPWSKCFPINYSFSSTFITKCYTHRYIPPFLVWLISELSFSFQTWQNFLAALLPALQTRVSQWIGFR